MLFTSEAQRVVFYDVRIGSEQTRLKENSYRLTTIIRFVCSKFNWSTSARWRQSKYRFFSFIFEFLGSIDGSDGPSSGESY